MKGGGHCNTPCVEINPESSFTEDIRQAAEGDSSAVQRIYLKYGEPQDRVVNHSPVDLTGGAAVSGSGVFAGEPPYEIWQYQTTSFVYLFVAEDLFGAWRLIYSTDPEVANLADWYNRTGPSALNDLQTNFGIKPRFGIG